MPGSHPETKPWVVNKFIEFNLLSSNVLDVGPGFGTFSDVLKSNGYAGSIDAVEIWQPYIDKYSLNSKYNKIYNEDIRNWKNFNYDVVLYGDILEHMSKEDAILVWENTKKYAKNAVITIPIIHYPQGASEGNPYEEHVKDDWTHEEVIETFDSIIDSWVGVQTAAYWGRFN